MRVMRVTRPAVIALGLLVLVVALPACSSGGDSGAPASTTTTTATKGKGAGSTPGVAATLAPTPAPTLAPCAFHGSTTKLESIGATSPGFLVDADAQAVGCVDRVTFFFDTAKGANTPGYVVEYVDPAQHPFVDGDPPTPIDVPGAAFLLVTIKPARSANPLVDGNPPTYTGNTSLAYGEHHHLVIVRKLPDGDNTVQWVIGLDEVRPFVVDRAPDPSRIAVSIG
jgi:hypothetical protein